MSAQNSTLLGLQPLRLTTEDDTDEPKTPISPPSPVWSPRTAATDAKEQAETPESVITQYTPQKDVGSPRAAAQSLKFVESKSQSRVPRRSWTSILCCVRPQSEGYSESPESEPVRQSIVRPSHPVAPPYHGKFCLGPQTGVNVNRKCLVLDLDETLVHSSFKPVPNADYIIPVEIDNKVTDVYVIKRPWVDDFMTAMAEVYEVVVFTASLAKYADPLLDLLDPNKTISFRLFRDSCCPFEGNYVKDLSRLGRDLPSTIIIDNSPHSYVFQPENAIPIRSFIGDSNDQDLLNLTPFLLSIRDHPDVRDVLMDCPKGGRAYT